MNIRTYSDPLNFVLGATMVKTKIEFTVTIICLESQTECKAEIKKNQIGMLIVKPDTEVESLQQRTKLEIIFLTGERGKREQIKPL